MAELNHKATDILTFIPSGNDFETAIEFYTEIGFEVCWRDDQLATLKKDNCSFFLQNISNWGEGNFMMSLEVENVDDWWEMLQQLKLPERYKDVKLKAPENYPWGKRAIHLRAPSGILWHISSPVNE